MLLIPVADTNVQSAQTLVKQLVKIILLATLYRGVIHVERACIMAARDSEIGEIQIIRQMAHPVVACYFFAF